jgi:glycerol dehydrogenase
MSGQRTHLSVFCSPERYVQGRDATEELGVQLKAVGIKAPGVVLLVATASPRRLLEQTWRRVLHAAGYELVLLDFIGDCTARSVDHIADEARSRKAAAIVAAGGGQVIDACRAAADSLDAPFVSCPTVASTDGEREGFFSWAGVARRERRGRESRGGGPSLTVVDGPKNSAPAD